jgi:saccharopine dehydrogenase-like NADP-dependent oxidoreductase
VKILLLGGTGDMGRRAAKDLVLAQDVDLVTIAGRTSAKAESLAREVGPKAKAAAVDVNAHGPLIELMREHDVVAGAVGPYYLYEVPLARAAIAAGVPYVSLCDDYDGAQGVLELDTQAKERGVTVLTGAGWTPGLTNVLVRKAAEQLDSAREAHVAWAASASDSSGYAVLFHMLHILTGDVPSYRGGRWITVRAGTGDVVVDFGGRLGKVKVYHVGHPEPVTLPRFLPELEEVTLRGGLSEGYLNALGKLMARAGLTRTHKRRERLVKLLSGSMALLKRLGALDEPVSGLHVEVRGVRKGRPATVRYRGTGAMADLTALPLAVATLMVGRGQVQGSGVLAPESPGALDPDVFLQELADRGVVIEPPQIEEG